MTTKKTPAAEILTDDMIRSLRTEATTAGDTAMGSICTEALGGDRHAQEECARTINEARAQDDALCSVRVILEEEDLHPEQTHTRGWRVLDRCGGAWYPDDAALEEILSAGDVEAQTDRAYEICLHAPMRGEWHS